MTDVSLYIRRLLEANPLREPLLRSAIDASHLLRGTIGLDAGCGIGLQTLLLLEAVGPRGHITGLDILPELLEYGSAMVRKAGLSDRITFRQGDVERLPFDDNSFDWVWSADCIGYPAGELTPLLHELVRVLKPGGSIILLGWSSQQLLPGYPLLEARLNGTCSGYVPFLQGKDPASTFARAIYWLRQVGLEDVQAQTLVRDLQGPFNDAERTALGSLFEMLWGAPQPDVSPEDWMEYQRLCNPESADFILNIPDYYGFYTCSMFRGKVPMRKN